jgi:hypothetical protein
VKEVGTAILGVATFLLIWGALPLWMWWFDSRVLIHFPDSARKRGQRYMALGAAWILLTIWLIWRYVLPDWWIEATPMLSNE